MTPSTNLWQRGLFLGFLCLLATWALYPSYRFYFHATPQQRESKAMFCQTLPKWLPCRKLNLGLDLQGGVHLVMGVGTEQAVMHRSDRLAESLKQSLPLEITDEVDIARGLGKTTLVVTLHGAQNDSNLLATVVTQSRNFSELTLLERSSDRLVFDLHAEARKHAIDFAVEQSIKTIRNRADKLGVVEPSIVRRGQRQILIQLPGIFDPQHAIDVIGKTAQLEFLLLHNQANKVLASIKSKTLPAGVHKVWPTLQRRPQEVYLELPEASSVLVSQLVEPLLPSDSRLVFGAASLGSGEPGKEGRLRTFVVQQRAQLTGEYLVNAQVQQNRESGGYEVVMSFDRHGAKLFEKITREHIGQPLAIVLDGMVNSAPMINEAIAGGSARITLGRSLDGQAAFAQAKDLALVLKAGALPAPVQVEEKRQVGKTLGQDTVRRGSVAMGLGTLLVLLFMAWYYRLSGMVANLALLLNVVFLLALLALMEATLTLPGMAGIVLTVGMAVDANVLIFERVREELKLHAGVRAAIDAGYRKAFATIVDSNVTTMIAGVVLLQYGSGPVQGFAVTLLLGLLCSMYTAVVVTRWVFDVAMQRRVTRALSI